MTGVAYTIGHSTHSTEEFIALLVHHQITAVADVRSHPYSRFNPQFNRDALAKSLKPAGIEYVFLGDELGARPKDRNCYVAHKTRYDLLATTASFQRGLERITQGIQTHRLAMMCAEKDPLVCHRTILVSRHLAARGIVIHHILEDGSLESHDEAIARLLAELGLPDHDLFRGHDEIVSDAYGRREVEIAFTDGVPTGETEGLGANR